MNAAERQAMSAKYLASVRSLRASISRLMSQESGIAAVEFAMVLPILLVLWIGGVEVTSGLSIDRRLNNFASSMGDLVSRTKQIPYSRVEDIFDLAEAALFPYEETGISMRITAVTIETNGNAKVAWSRARGMTAHAKDTQVNDSVPASLRPPSDRESQIIMAEVLYTYQPAIGYVITSEIELEDRMYFVPRVSSKVKICPMDDQASCVESI
jgi:Flp pilus assembly protein TadG